jgi:hypothetical protein
MASGKKNYFRHSMFARNDDFVMGIMDKFGLDGYYYWFALIEMCAEQCADEMKIVCRFHESSLYAGLRCNSRRLRPVLDYMQTSTRLLYNYSDKFYEIEIANLSKYMGFYENKKESNSSKERKGNEIKIKERKEKLSSSFSPSLSKPVEGCVEDIPDAFRQEFGEKLLRSNWEKNHEYYFQNKIKKDYFDFQHESLTRTRDKFGDEKKDYDEVMNYFKEIEEENERYRANLKAEK